MMSRNETVPNAKEVLPKDLLKILQGFCSGNVYIPPKLLQSQISREQIRELHDKGITPSEIARETTISVKHARRIIKQLGDGVMQEPIDRQKIYGVVPEVIVAMVQSYVEGFLYVPSTTSSVVRRYSRVKRLLRAGHTISSVASLTGMSTRRVRQLRDEYAKDVMPPKKVVVHKDVQNGSFQNIANEAMSQSQDPDEIPPRLCPLCGTPVEPHEITCVICSRPTKVKDDPDVLVLSHFPFAYLDRKF
ncbi:MAG: winged helix-turn-helix domain-containing protein [Armatimonadota bacterium]